MTLTRRNLVLGCSAGLATVASLYGLSRLIVAPAPAEGLAQILPQILDDPDAPVLGNPDGDVTVVEYFDYQCSFCRAGHEALVAGIAKDGQTRLLLRDWPILGAASVYASQITLGAAGLGQYHAVNSALMAIKGRLDEPRINATLSGLGIDPDLALASYHDNRRAWDSFMIRNDRQARQLGFQGTPSFVIGAKTHSGVLSAAALDKAIRKARAQGQIQTDA